MPARTRAGAAVGRNHERLFEGFHSSPGRGRGPARVDNADYSMISSARARSVGGILTPISFAVLRFTINSNLAGSCTGSSPGLKPREILSTYLAAPRNNSILFGANEISPPASTYSRYG